MRPPSTSFLFYPWAFLRIKKKGKKSLMPTRPFSSKMRNLMRIKMTSKGKTSLTRGQR